MQFNPTPIEKTLSNIRDLARVYEEIELSSAAHP